jgi:hypothetical protein
MKKAKGKNGRPRKKEPAARNAEVAADSETKEIMAKTRPLWPQPKIDVDKQDVRAEDEGTTSVAQTLQVEIEALQDVVECEDTTYEEYEDHHFLTVEVKEELDEFFDRKEEVKRMCVVCLLVTVHSANPDEATWSGKNGTISKIRKAMALPAKTRLEHILRDALDHRQRGEKHTGK